MEHGFTSHSTLTSRRSFQPVSRLSADYWEKLNRRKGAGSILSVKFSQNVESQIAFFLWEIRKIIKIVAAVCHFKAKMYQNPISSSGAALQTPLVGELTALTQTS